MRKWILFSPKAFAATAYHTSAAGSGIKSTTFHLLEHKIIDSAYDSVARYVSKRRPPKHLLNIEICQG